MRPEHNRLLDDLYQPGASRDALLTAGRAILRRKRRVRVVQRISGVAFTLLAIVALVHQGSRSTMLKESQKMAGTKVLTVASANATNTAAPPKTSVPVLTDDQLLALFPGTPVGLAMVNGKKQLIFPRPEDRERYVIHISSSQN